MCFGVRRGRPLRIHPGQSRADRKFTGTTATGFFDAPNAAIMGRMVWVGRKLSV
ncbi:MAG: hypothetical protein HC851_22145 [Acaryochloris sp. RU_4_1]|nr:hypothetical protein [Acaryochloris sp. RU_4_1]NJR55030.1 hypothetical protein [Acaryochloris sp. CRU_2_0]